MPHECLNDAAVDALLQECGGEVVAQLVGGGVDSGSAQGPGDDGADGLGSDMVPGVAGAGEPEAFAGVVAGLVKDDGVGGQEVGSTAFSGDGEGAAGGVDVLASDLGDLMDA